MNEQNISEIAFEEACTVDPQQTAKQLFSRLTHGSAYAHHLLDGLATGIAVVASATVLAASLVFGNVAVVIGCVALLGSLIGFGRYNLPPARIFLGDSGSLFIGFFLAVLSVDSSIKSTTRSELESARPSGPSLM